MCDLEVIGVSCMYRPKICVFIFIRIKKNEGQGMSLIVYYVIVVYYESLKRALKTKTIYGCRCDERLKTNVEESTRLTGTPLCAELEHLKIETSLTRVYY